MDRDILQHLPVVATVARRRSSAGAAAELGLGASAVSHAVRMVEDRLRTPLFARTMRSVSLTEADKAFLSRALPALDTIHEAAEATQALKGRVSGVLRINAPRVALPMRPRLYSSARARFVGSPINQATAGWRNGACQHRRPNPKIV